VRLEIGGLYRSRAMKRHLEKALRAVRGIHMAEANERTGRLLVVHSGDISLDEVLAQVAGLIGGSVADARAQPEPAAQAGEAAFDFSPLLRGITAAIHGASSLLGGGPALGIASGAAADAADAATEGQPLRPWHLYSLGEVLNLLDVSGGLGLDEDEARRRLALYGGNLLQAAERRSDLAIFVDQFNSLPVALLAVSALVSFVTGGRADAAVILGVVLINSAIGFVTERQAELTISSLAKSGAQTVNVLRGGATLEIGVEEVVPGDLLLLSPGTYISADIRLLKSHRLTVDESALTGESLPIVKDHGFQPQGETPLGDRRNMAYMGTHVTGGDGAGVVVATAHATELGQIQTMVGEAEAPETPMQRQLGKMGTQLALLSGAICVGVFGVGLLRGYGALEMLKSAVSLAVAAVPEGLPAVATTTLAMGISNMRKHKVSVRHLDAVESLGSVQVFCMDKTGTLTQNRMAVVQVHTLSAGYRVSDGEFATPQGAVEPLRSNELVRLMQVVSLCSETKLTEVSGELQYEGSPTENALVQMAVQAGMDVAALRTEHPTLRMRYRAEGRPYMTSLHPSAGNSHLLAVKGSPDAVLAMCEWALKDGRRVRLSAQARRRILDENRRMSGDALRVLGVAYRELDEGRMPGRTGKLVWLGLAGMADPLRPGMKDLIADYHRAGIETIMITGDQSGTAYAIGRELGLSGDKPLNVLESSRLEGMDAELLAGLVKNVHVFARVSPAHKLEIVQALQKAGLVVAMTGDGINDGPALKAADVGVAMGAGGTNVARDVSDVVLEDDNLHTMTVAISQGRTIYNNIRKMIHFMVSTNLTEIEVMLAGVALGLGQPMNPMQLLWINLVTDIFPGLALSMEPGEPDIMQRPPRASGEQIIDADNLRRMVFESGMIGLGTMGAYLYGLRRSADPALASTLAFNTLTLSELAHSWSARSEHRVLFGGGQHLTPNPHLKRTILAMGGLQAAVSLLPPFRRLLGTAPMGLVDLAVVAGGVLLPLMVNEATKPAAPPEMEDGGNRDGTEQGAMA